MQRNLLWITKDTFIALFTKEISRFLGAQCQETKTKYIFISINYSITKILCWRFCFLFVTQLKDIYLFKVVLY